MEVTKTNFHEVLAALPDVFERAQFITFDTEFTGLRIEGLEAVGRYDTLETLYLKNKLKAETFMVIQYGIVAFFYDESTNSYSHEGYNFYVYPSPLSHDKNFTCQASSIHLLVEHGFDFNKLIKDGIPYLTDDETNILYSKVDEKSSKDVNANAKCYQMEIPASCQSFISSIIQRMRDILNSGKQESFEIEKNNRFIRRLIYNAVKCQFDDKVFLITNKNETMTAHVGLTKAEYMKHIENKYASERQNITDNIGFSAVLKLIMKSGKLFIGHNICMDLMFTIHQFLQKLPDTYKEFTELSHFLFPNVLDTKYLVTQVNIKNLKDTGLISTLEHFEKSGHILETEISKNGFGFTLKANKLHAAAYDAYVTGVCFLAICNYLGMVGKIDNMLSQLPTLKGSVNKISAPKLQNITCIDLVNYTGEPDRQNVYYIEFPREWDRTKLEQVFHSCGNIDIAWLNNVSAYVSLTKSPVHSMKSLKITDDNYKLYTFSEYCSSLISRCRTPFAVTANDAPERGNASNAGNCIIKNLKRKLAEDIGEVVDRP